MSTPFTWVEISKSAIKHNIQQYKKILKPSTQLMTVVKSNAYGHGMAGFAKLAVKYGIDWLGVVNLDEALELRKHGIKAPILVLGYYPLDKRLLTRAIRRNISLVVYSVEQLKLLNRIGKSISKKVKVHLKIDTGTSRLGVLVKDALPFVVKVSKFKNIEIEGIFSHFAASEENQKFTLQQLKSFNRLIKRIESRGIKIPLKHFACSAAVLVQPQSHFNLVRIGIASYGLWPSYLTKRICQKKYPHFNLKPVLSLYTKIVQLKILPKGTFIGYGCTYKTKRKTKLAILPIGYWEGFDRHLSHKGRVIIKDKFCQVLGRVCMNLIMVDATNVPNLKVGERVVIIGKQGRKEISVEELAQKIGTINYEIVTRINPLLPRIYVK